jgi:hypothetical protein
MLNALYTYSDSYSSVGHEIATGAIWFAGAMMFFGLLCLLAQILIAIAVYNDAMAKGNSEPVMWGVLTGILVLFRLLFISVYATPTVIVSSSARIAVLPIGLANSIVRNAE